MAEEKFNMRNPAVKRILQEVKDMQNNPSHEYLSMPLEDNIFEWHFAILGPEDSEFEGGIYHGRIQLPSEYPFKPPAFMLLTPNGRFETQTKICLSISQHHPEHWQPSWSVRTALVALIAFMPTKPDGALGSLDYTKEERRALAIKSRIAPKFGNSERQNLIDEIHEQMMRTAPPVPDLAPAHPTVLSDGNSQDIDNTSTTNAENAPQMVENVHELHVNANAGPIALSITAGFSLSTRAPAARQEPNPAAAPRVAPHELETEPTVIRRRQPSDDRGWTLLAIGLTVAIVALLAKKFLKFYGWVDL